jgi:excisionase family DNA binding protein
MKHQKSKQNGIAAIPSTILTVRELSEHLRVHPTTVYRLLRNRQIPGFRVGSDWRFDLAMIDRWSFEQTAVSAQHPKPVG